MDLKGYEIEIDPMTFREVGGSVILDALVYKDDVLNFKHPVVMPAHFYNQTMEMPDGKETILGLATRRTTDELKKRLVQKPVPVQQLLDLGSKRVQL